MNPDLAHSDLAYLDVALANFDLPDPGIALAKPEISELGVVSPLRRRIQLVALGVVTIALCTLLFAWPHAVHSSAEIDAIGLKGPDGARSGQSLAGWFDDARRAHHGVEAPMRGQLVSSPGQAGMNDRKREIDLPFEQDLPRGALSAPYFAPDADKKAAIVGVKAAPGVADDSVGSPLARSGQGDLERSNRDSAPSAPGVTASSSDSERNWSNEDGRIAAGAELMEQIDFDLEAIGYSLSFEAARESLLGLTLLDLQHIEIYVRPGMSDAAVLDVIGHEIGHAVDHMILTPDDRLAWQIARGMNVNEPWFPTTLDSDLATPAGDFAECFSWLLTDSPSYSAWGACQDVDVTLLDFTTN